MPSPPLPAAFSPATPVHRPDDERHGPGRTGWCSSSAGCAGRLQSLTLHYRRRTSSAHAHPIDDTFAVVLEADEVIDRIVPVAPNLEANCHAQPGHGRLQLRAARGRHLAPGRSPPTRTTRSSPGRWSPVHRTSRPMCPPRCRLDDPERRVVPAPCHHRLVPERIRRSGDRLVLTLYPAEVEVLRDLAGQLESLFDGGVPERGWRPDPGPALPPGVPGPDRGRGRDRVADRGPRGPRAPEERRGRRAGRLARRRDRQAQRHASS